MQESESIDDHFDKANTFLRALIDGAKKYSPPLGTTHSAVKERLLFWLLGSGLVPDITRTPPALVCPIMGSSPGCTGLLNIKSELFAHS